MCNESDNKFETKLTWQLSYATRIVGVTVCGYMAPSPKD